MNTIERILKILHEKGIQQKELAKELEFGENNISSWISGKSHSYKKYIHQIADYLDTSVQYLRCETDDPTPPNKKSYSEDTEQDNLMSEILKVLPNPTDEELEKLIDYAHYIVSSRDK